MWTFPVVSSIINTKYDGFQQVSKEKNVKLVDPPWDK